MKSFLTSAKKITFCILFAFVFALIGFSNLQIANAYTYSKKSSIEIDNASFESYSSRTTGQPYSVNSWTVDYSSNVAYGVISTKLSDFADNNKFYLEENPGTDGSISSADDYIFMFKLNGGSSTSGRGSITSSKETLSSSSFYAISLHAKTTNGAQGSAYLSIDENAVMNISASSGNWKTYTFLVATDAIKTQDFTLSLCYGNGTNNSSGEVFYDEINVEEISELDFFSTTQSSNVVKIDLSADRKNASTATNFENNDFENSTDALTGWEKQAVSGNGVANFGVAKTSTIDTLINNAGFSSNNFATTYAYGNTSSLYFINKDAVTSTISSSEDNLLVVPQHSLYKLSMLVRTGDISGTGLKVTLTPENETLSAITLSASDADSAVDCYNGYSLLSFYIKGSTIQDENVSMSISLEDASGWAIVDDINLVPLTSSEYSSATSSAKLDLSTEIVDTENISNGRFDFVTLDSYSLSYPLQPENWTFSGESNTSGVIRVNPEVFENDKLNYGSPLNPGFNSDFYSGESDTNYNENVLMLWNKTSSEIYYSSQTKSLSSTASTVEFSVGVKTLGNATAFVRVVDSNGNILAELDNINTNNAWKMQYIYVKNGLNAITVHLEIGMEGALNTTKGEYVFFDCVDYNTTEVTSKAKETNNYTYLDLVNNNFTSHLSSKTNEFYKIHGFSVLDGSQDDLTYGVVDAKDFSDLPLYSNDSDNKVFAIKLSNANYLTLKTDYTYSLTQGKYYEFSVWVKSDGLAKEDGQKFGALFEIVSIDSDGNILDRTDSKTAFSNIITSADDNFGWTKYSINVLCESDQNVKILLGVGDEENYVQGTAYFDNLTAQELDESTYASLSADDKTIVTATIKASSDDENSDDNSNSTSNSESANINIFAIFSSILLMVALVLAIAGYVIRKVPKTKKPKKVKKQPSYSKKPTAINKIDVAREIGEQRKLSAEELEVKLEALKNQLEIVKNEYNEKTKDDEYVNQKLYKEYSIVANKLSSQIENLESAKAYLTSQQIAKHVERKTIKRKTKQAKKEFEKLKKQKDEPVKQSETPKKRKRK